MNPTIRIYDTQFKHSKGGSFGTGDFNTPPTYFNYSWDDVPNGKVAIITESSFRKMHEVKEPIKIALLLETKALYAYEWISKPENYKQFDMVLTHHRHLLSIDDRFKYFAFGGSWIKPEDWKIYDKTKNISIIASGKRDTKWQIARHEVIEQFAKQFNIDVYGRGYNPVDYKLDALKDYRYSIVIENEPVDGFFTEKITDCFATGTVPIYWGDPNIGMHFNEEGIIKMTSVNDINSLSQLNLEETYTSILPYLPENLEKAKQYRLPEDAIWENYLKQYF